MGSYARLVAKPGNLQVPYEVKPGAYLYLTEDGGSAYLYDTADLSISAVMLLILEADAVVGQFVTAKDGQVSLDNGLPLSLEIEE